MGVKVGIPDEDARNAKVTELFVYDNFVRTSVDEVSAGDICAFSGIPDIGIGQVFTSYPTSALKTCVFSTLFHWLRRITKLEERLGSSCLFTCEQADVNFVLSEPLRRGSAHHPAHGVRD
jgi:hypothetical protein